MRYLRVYVCVLLALSAIGCSCDNPLEPTVAGVTANKILLNVKVTGKSPMAVNETASFTATANYNDGTSVNVTTTAFWQTDNGANCKVDSVGHVTALLANQCTVSATITQGVGILIVDIFDVLPPGNPTPIPPGSPTTVGLTVTGHTELSVGEITPWTAVATFSDGTSANVTTQATWSSGASNFAAVSIAGVVSGIAGGTAAITATYQGLTASANVHVTASGPPTGPTVLSLSVAGLTSLSVGQSDPWHAVANMSDGTTVDVTTLASWSSASPSIATVNASGLVTGASAGTSAITAAFQGKTASANVTISSGPAPTVLSLSVSGLTTLTVGQTTPWTATANLSNGTTQNVTALAAWSSGSPSFATVNGSGVVSGVAAGTAAITAVYQGKTASANVTVSSSAPPTPTVVSLSVSGLASITVGQSTPWTATANMSDGTTQNVTTIAGWSSGSLSVATVNSSGVVTGVTPGTSAITAAYQGKTASANVTVSAGAATVLSVTVSGLASIVVGQSTPWTATAHMSDGTTQNVTTQSAWLSATPGAATVNSTGNVTGVAPGSSSISATFSGKSGSGTVTVTAAAPTRQLIGIEVDANVDLSKVHLNTLVQLHVFGVYSDGSKDDVTSSAVISPDDPLLRIDGPGLINVLLTMVAALTDPNHVINVTYGGFTAAVNVHLELPVIQSLQLGTGGVLDLHVGSQLPTVEAILSDATHVTLPANFPGLTFAMSPRGPLSGVLALLGVDLGSVLQTNGGLLSSLNNGIVASLFSNILLGGSIPVNLTASLTGITSNLALGRILQ